jgi:nucleotide-binding universal stress UspA family protein
VSSDAGFREKKYVGGIMVSYRRILLCYDGSLEGRKALHCGAGLAFDLQAETHLLAVVNIGAPIASNAATLIGFASDDFENAARTILQEGVDCLIERGLIAQGHFAIGDPVSEIAIHAETLKADLVVVGHRCRRSLFRWWMGAGNKALLDRVSCSVLVTCF